ncbi:MAG: GNAT family N-acetyltransferase [Acidobacteria bacterium]|nr:GNAT family N-acetyltransferase [Acidobacteriota bacterium]
MENEVRIEQMTLSERDKVLSFLHTAYSDNPRHSEPDFWDWHFQKLPLSSPENLPVWLAKSGERIAGQLAAIPVELNVRGETRPAIWILDLIIDPEFRRRGIAQRLAQAALEFCPFVLGINTVEQHSTGLLVKQGFKMVTAIPLS